jgi:hypothetical protein
MSTPLVLPDSRLTTDPKKGAFFHLGLWWTKIYCANCGADCGGVPEENCDFAFWLCNNCAERHGAIADTYMMPDEVYWAKVSEFQLEKYGRHLTPQELEQALDDPTHPLHRLARERPRAS